MDPFEAIMELRGETPEPHFGVFDWDGSLIHHDCAEATLHYMARHGIENARRDFERYYELLDAGDTRGAYRFGATTLWGLTIAEADRIVKQAMKEEGTELGKTELFGREIAKGIALRENVVALFKRLQDSGVDLWIVSASPVIVVRSVMDYFGIKAKLIGVQNVIDGYRITGELREPLSIYEGKVACIKDAIHPSIRPLFGVGDSMNDEPMLEYSQLRIVVDRGNALADKAKAEHWFLM
jgi:HAD superfamily phosphoserine phosphatase-like hydrolase